MTQISSNSSGAVSDEVASLSGLIRQLLTELGVRDGNHGPGTLRNAAEADLRDTVLRHNVLHVGPRACDTRTGGQRQVDLGEERSIFFLTGGIDENVGLSARGQLGSADKVRLPARAAEGGGANALRTDL